MNSPPILEPILVGIESDVHWGYDLDFDPWPHGTWQLPGPFEVRVVFQEAQRFPVDSLATFWASFGVRKRNRL